MNATWTHPKGSGIKLRRVTNQTIIDGKRQSFGEGFMVSVPAKLTGKGRLRRQFKTRQEAEAFAIEQVAGTKVLGEQFFELSAAERREAVAALDILRPLNLSLLESAQVVAAAHVKLGGRPIAEAVEYFARRNPAGMPIKTTAEVLLEMLDAKKADGASAVYLKDLQVRIGIFCDAFPGQIAGVTATGLNEWLRRLKCGPRARNNYRRAVGTLFAFAEAHGYVTKDHLDFSKVAKAKESANEIEIFTPAEMVKLLNARIDTRPGVNLRYAEGPGLLPLLALGGFAGLRTAEVQRQRWEDINFKTGFLRVTASKGGTASKRLVPISTALKAWLAPIRKDSGPVIELARLPDAVARLAKRAGVEWKHNALRHSWISYRCAETQNVAQTALEAGNSPAMVHRHYREAVTPGEAVAWFGILPETPANITQLPASVA